MKLGSPAETWQMPLYGPNLSPNSLTLNPKTLNPETLNLNPKPCKDLTSLR